MRIHPSAPARERGSPSRQSGKQCGSESRAPGAGAGFSLVEVLCAILILGVALVGLTQAITTALGSGKESELQTTAALLAAGKLEELRADGLILNGVTDGEFGGGLSLYRWKQTVSDTQTAGLHEVSVVIEHTGTGQPIYELQTLLFDPPLASSSGGDRQDSPRSRRREAQR